MDRMQAIRVKLSAIGVQAGTGLYNTSIVIETNAGRFEVSVPREYESVLDTLHTKLGFEYQRTSQGLTLWRAMGCTYIRTANDDNVVKLAKTLRDLIMLPIYVVEDESVELP